MAYEDKAEVTREYYRKQGVKRLADKIEEVFAKRAEISNVYSQTISITELRELFNENR